MTDAEAPESAENDALVRYETTDGIASLTLNRPQARNSLSRALMTALQDRLDEIAGSPARVVVLAAEGPAFCAGHDLKEMRADPRRETDAAMFRKVWELSCFGGFLAGKAAYGDARYEDALRHFKRAYELSKRPVLLFNIGQAADKLRRDREALDAFKAYLEQVPGGEGQREAESRVRVLERVLDPK